MAERIGGNAVEYVRKHWRMEDMQVYVSRQTFLSMNLPELNDLPWRNRFIVSFWSTHGR